MVALYQKKVSKEVGAPVLMSANPATLAADAKKSIFATKETVLAFVNNPNADLLSIDPLRKVAITLATEQKLASEKYVLVDENFAQNSRLFLDGLKKSQPEKSFYPDANSTMRLTYGSIDTLPKRADRKYKGIKQNYYTTMEGMVAKYKKGDEEFDLPKRLMDLQKKKDYGKYADKDGKLYVNFLSNNDITGGNSGSPILNAEGHLIGLAFDGNSEALSGDIVFEPKLQRTINVDARYVLWVIEKFAGAGHLISELELVK